MSSSTASNNSAINFGDTLVRTVHRIRSSASSSRRMMNNNNNHEPVNAVDDNNNNSNNNNRQQQNNNNNNNNDIIIASSQQQQCATFYQEHCSYLPAMLGWFLFSALLSSYNKLVFGSGHYHFPCPLLMTSLHFLTQWIFSYIITTIFPISLGTERITSMSWYEWCITSIPCGVVTSGDVGLSNLSLVRITITFYTMVKASTPIFVLGWAYIFGIEDITIQLIAVVVIIAAGEFLTVVGEVDFDQIGLILCLSASVLSGARWTLVQLKLRSLQPPIKTVFATMRLLSPSMFFSLFFISIIIEQPNKKLAGEDIHDLFKNLLLGLSGAFLAISMVLCEFWLIMRANAIVLMIGGVIKEMVTIIIGVSYFGDELNKINISGCFVVFLGVFLYKVIHYLDAQEKKQQLIDDSEREIFDTINNDDDNNDNNVNNNDTTTATATTRILSRNLSPKSLSRRALQISSTYQKVESGDDPLDVTDGLYKDTVTANGGNINIENNTNKNSNNNNRSNHNNNNNNNNVGSSGGSGRDGGLRKHSSHEGLELRKKNNNNKQQEDDLLQGDNNGGLLEPNSIV